MEAKEGEEKSWLLGTAKPAGGKSYEAINAPVSRSICSRLGITVKKVVLAAVVITIAWLLLHGFSRRGGPEMSFVTANGLQFQADCRPFYPAGFNTHDLMQAALMTTYDYKMRISGKARIREMMGQASGAGLNLMRTWAHTNHKKFHFQDEPGKYNENTFRALDYILDEARKHGIRVILSFVDNWKYYNGVDQYIDWSPTAPKRGVEHVRPEDKDGDPTPLAFQNENIKKYEVTRHSLFYTDEGAKTFYKDHVLAILNRKNHLNGRHYKNDPTIFAWDLLNEPRCESYVVHNCPQLLQAWIEEMSAFVKREDPRHMVTIGSEGFFAKDSKFVQYNPKEWAQDMGQNWTGNHLVDSIDFATIHVWPNNWQRTDDKFNAQWIESHIQAAGEIGKPMLMEEFGKKLEGHEEDSPTSMIEKRDPVYLQTYGILEEAMQKGMNVQGSLFWRWNMPLFSHMGRGDYGVRPRDSTFGYVLRHTRFINAHTNSVPPGQECKTECWVPISSDWSRKCKNVPEVCESYWNNPGSQHKSLRVFPSYVACCRPGQGAFIKGCSWSIF